MKLDKVANSGNDESSFGREVIPFTALIRSRLAECLGVDDGQEFEADDERYVIQDDAVWRVFSNGNKLEPSSLTVCWLINHPEEITPCPRWSEATIAAARAAYLIGFRYVMRRGNDPQALLTVAHTCNDGFYADIGLFLEIHPGTTVKLEGIK